MLEGLPYLKVPWTARRSNQSILKKINPEYSLEGLMLKLKLQYFDHRCEALTHWKRRWCWEGLRTTEGCSTGWDGWMESPTQGTWIWANSRRQWSIAEPGMLQSMGSQSQTGVSNWTVIAYISTTSCLHSTYICSNILLCILIRAQITIPEITSNFLVCLLLFLSLHKINIKMHNFVVLIQNCDRLFYKLLFSLDTRWAFLCIISIFNARWVSAIF